MKRKLKKEVKYVIYSLCAVTTIALIFIIQTNSQPKLKENDNFEYVHKTIFENIIPVVADVNIIRRPFLNPEVTIAKGYYDYTSDIESQQNSILVTENTYMQNTGVSYSYKDKFEITPILDGTVIKIKEDNILGKIIQIRHTNDIISIYQSLSDIKVKENDTVKQGDIIGISGTSNIDSSIKNHLHFELIIAGTNVNPENYYDISIKDL